MENAIHVLNFYKIHYKLTGYNEMEVYFLGCYDENYNMVEKELSKVGLYATKRSYTKNKTSTIYKFRG